MAQSSIQGPLWSVDRSKLLTGDKLPPEALVLPAGVISAKVAVDKLNSGALSCPEGLAIVTSVSRGGKYLLVRRGKEAEAEAAVASAAGAPYSASQIPRPAPPGASRQGVSPAVNGRDSGPCVAKARPVMVEVEVEKVGDGCQVGDAENMQGGKSAGAGTSSGPGVSPRHSAGAGASSGPGISPRHSAGPIANTGSLWSTDRAMHVRQGYVLQPGIVTAVNGSVPSVDALVEKFNASSFTCPDGLCAVTPAAPGGQVLLFQSHREAQAIAALEKVLLKAPADSQMLFVLDFDLTLTREHITHKYASLPVGEVPIADDTFVDLAALRTFVACAYKAGHNISVASFGRREVVDRALVLAFGNGHGITTLTPSTFGGQDGTDCMRDKNVMLESLQKRYGVQKECMLMLDDDLKNVEVARAAGFGGLHVLRGGATHQVLGVAALFVGMPFADATSAQRPAPQVPAAGETARAVGSPANAMSKAPIGSYALPSEVPTPVGGYALPSKAPLLAFSGSDGSWAAHQAIALPADGASRLGVKRLPSEVDSVKQAVEKLSSGQVACPEGLCVVRSAARQADFVLYRLDRLDDIDKQLKSIGMVGTGKQRNLTL